MTSKRTKTPKTVKPAKLPNLPDLLKSKIYKAGQTRGADDDVIYQNRVGRNSTVLIPYSSWNSCSVPPNTYKNGFIVLISPTDYFSVSNIGDELLSKGLVLGKNALVFYETREQWNTNNPEKLGWQPPTQRKDPLGGQYAARIPATTSTTNGEEISRGFNTTSLKGAGIRVYEYASDETIEKTRLQLEALFWLCVDADKIVTSVETPMTSQDAATRKKAILDECKNQGLLDIQKLQQRRILNKQGKTVCPLCLEEISGRGFFKKVEQAEGREVPDLTVTHINLFHIEELRTGVFNHRPYNLGWGHHHCNVVVKDSGIDETLKWMRKVLNVNIEAGYLPKENNEI
jgi:hypothetical protein